ncbi:MAG: sulfurtransferase TusA family protein [Firmicutes bacterium HGW-Firmicutes-14]|jgi:TusA-related sulfurtransferase|nr:MAG: sulfurtransferase TusA family protein [Firmicutes bacterium HGW-Firmicutes-14]
MGAKKLDLLGEVCPFSLLKTRQELEKIKPGEKLTVETDFNQSVRNILKWCDNQGYGLDIAEKGSGVWQITITKK